MNRYKLLALAAALSGVMGAASAETTLTVYTALEADQIKAYQAAFEKANPDIKIQWVRDSTGIITAKLLAEKNNPKADAIWGLAGTSLGLMDKEGMLQPYAPKGLDQIAANMRDAKAEPSWVGMDGFAAAICFNTVEAEKQKLPKPTSWQDLTKPVYAGKIVMPNPASSGTGFLDVSAWLQIFGEEKGWAYMDALHKNIGSYTHSGSKPCNLAASGEFPIGVSFDYRAAPAEGRRRAGRSRVPVGRPGLGSRSHRHRQGHQEPGSRPQAGRLLRQPRGQRAVQGQLRRAGHPVDRHVQPEPAGRSDQAHDQERLHLGRHQPRPHHRRVDQALRRQVRAEEEVSRQGRAAPRGRCPLHPGSPSVSPFRSSSR